MIQTGESWNAPDVGHQTPSMEKMKWAFTVPGGPKYLFSLDKSVKFGRNVSLLNTFSGSSMLDSFISFQPKADPHWITASTEAAHWIYTLFSHFFLTRSSVLPYLPHPLSLSSHLSFPLSHSVIVSFHFLHLPLFSFATHFFYTSHFSSTTFPPSLVHHSLPSSAFFSNIIPLSTFTVTLDIFVLHFFYPIIFLLSLSFLPTFPPFRSLPLSSFLFVILPLSLHPPLHPLPSFRSFPLSLPSATQPQDKWTNASPVIYSLLPPPPSSTAWGEEGEVHSYIYKARKVARVSGCVASLAPFSCISVVISSDNIFCCHCCQIL